MISCRIGSLKSNSWFSEISGRSSIPFDLGLDRRSAAHIICDPELFFEVERYRERKPLQAPLAFELDARFAINRSQNCVAQPGQPQSPCQADRIEIFVQGKAIDQKSIRAGCARLLPQ